MRLASVRRSLFTNDATRSKFLAHLMTGTREILQTGKGMFDVLYCGTFLCLDCIYCALGVALYATFSFTVFNSMTEISASHLCSLLTCYVQYVLILFANFSPHRSYFNL